MVPMRPGKAEREIIMGLSAMILAAAIAASAPQAGGADAEVPSVTVAVHDLDLSTSAGQKRLRVRLDSQIRRMCSVAGPVDAHMSRLRNACLGTAKRSGEVAFAQAVASARTELAAR
jgi:UrcA family protein